MTGAPDHHHHRGQDRQDYRCDLDEVETHVRALARDRWPTFPPLTDSERQRVHELLDQYTAEHERRVRERAALIERAAHKLGGQVARHDLTRAEAAARLDQLATHVDDTCPVPLYLIPYREALDIARRAFAAGFSKEHDARSTRRPARQSRARRHLRRHRR
jgi:hypothetical protein